MLKTLRCLTCGLSSFYVRYQFHERVSNITFILCYVMLFLTAFDFLTFNQVTSRYCLQRHVFSKSLHKVTVFSFVTTVLFNRWNPFGSNIRYDAFTNAEVSVDYYLSSSTSTQCMERSTNSLSIASLIPVVNSR